MNELEQDKRYVFGDMIIVATTDFDFNPILKISTDDGNVIVMPSSNNKIIVKSTGVLVDVTPQLNINSQHSKDYLYVCDNMVYRECELDFSAIDWEQRRYELAKAAMQGILSNSHEQVMSASSNMTAEWSLGFADTLIKKLKGE